MIELVSCMATRLAGIHMDQALTTVAPIEPEALVRV
jgi:hypothetical protein